MLVLLDCQHPTTIKFFCFSVRQYLEVVFLNGRRTTNGWGREVRRLRGKNQEWMVEVEKVVTQYEVNHTNSQLKKYLAALF